MKTLVRFIAPAVAAAALLAPHAALAASTFYGIVQHVSMQNIKVYNPKDHRALSFMILPKFDQVFSADGKTTYQMKAIKAGRYVGVVYDQKALGMRHADKIYLLTNANQKIATQ